MLLLPKYKYKHSAPPFQNSPKGTRYPDDWDNSQGKCELLISLAEKKNRRREVRKMTTLWTSKCVRAALEPQSDSKLRIWNYRKKMPLEGERAFSSLDQTELTKKVPEFNFVFMFTCHFYIPSSFHTKDCRKWAMMRSGNSLLDSVVFNVTKQQLYEIPVLGR